MEKEENRKNNLREILRRIRCDTKWIQIKFKKIILDMVLNFYIYFH